MTASAVGAAVFFLLVAALLGWHARKIWVDPGYADRITAQGPVGSAIVSRKRWPGVVGAAVPMAAAIGFMVPATLAVGAAGPARPGHPDAAAWVAAVCFAGFFACFGCCVTIIWSGRPRWLVPPHLRSGPDDPQWRPLSR